MVRETVVSGETRADEPQRTWHDALRPAYLSEVVGQREVVQRLSIALDAARKRGEPLRHILFDGPPGLGKTTLAFALANELGTVPQITSGPALTAPKDLLPYLTNAGEGSVLFIDEVHRLPPAVEEYLYPAMEEFRIDIVLGEGVNARAITMRLKPFTVVAATTRSGMLTGPLRERFHIHERVEFYTVEELTEIVRRNARKLKTHATDTACREIALRSRGTPRVANRRLLWARDYATSIGDGRISRELAVAALEMQGVDIEGLDAQDRRYLETLIRVFGGGPAGLEAIAHTMNVAPDTLADEVEPYLLRRQYVVRTPRGRVVTAAAYDHLKIAAPPVADDGQKNLF